MRRNHPDECSAAMVCSRSMARIRIVDSWLRSPAAAPTYQPAVMVVAEAWAEQRVLMRAFANSPDQTRPTIVLHGVHLAIGPAGLDAHGAWGIHVEPPADGRAQELLAQLELAARRLAGSKGNPPRLVDEAPSFDRKRTNHWAPGTPPDLPPPSGHGAAPPGYYEPSASPPPHPPSSYAAYGAYVDGPPPAAPPLAPPLARGPEPRPDYRPGQGGRPGASSSAGSATAHGFAGGEGARTPERGSTPAPPASQARIASIVGRTMPVGFQLSAVEREVLDALDRSARLSASDIARIAGTADGAAWMTAFMARLAGFGLDVIAPAGYMNAEPTYTLRR
jgi:hypothetical protein